MGLGLSALFVLVLPLGACGQRGTPSATEPGAPVAAQPAAPALANAASTTDTRDAEPPTENGVYVARGICFGEGDCFTNWRAGEPVALRARIDDDAPVAASVAPGEWVEAVDGQYRLIPRRGVVRVAGQGLSPGEVVFLLEPQGEGDMAIWRRGQTATWNSEGDGAVDWEDKAPVSPPSEKSLGWWVQVKTESGGLYWVHDPRFECMGKLAGDSGCRD